MTEKQKTNWRRIFAGSLLFSLGGQLFSALWQTEVLGLLLALFFFGASGGWIVKRHGWLAGLIIGLPLALAQLTRLMIRDYGSLPAVLSQLDYWRLVVPAAVVSTGVCIMGGLAGAWLQDSRLKRGS